MSDDKKTEKPADAIADLSAQPVAPVHEARATPRYRARWRVEVTLDAQTTYYGHIKDISVNGAAVLLEHNIKSLPSATLFIEITFEQMQTPPHIIQVEGKVVDTIYEGDSAYFRSSITFRRFIPAEDRAFLEHHLQQHCLQIT